MGCKREESRMTLRFLGPATGRGEVPLLGATAKKCRVGAVRSQVLDMLSGDARRVAGNESAAQIRVRRHKASPADRGLPEVWDWIAKGVSTE